MPYAVYKATPIENNRMKRNERFRPILFISKATGATAHAVPITIRATGKVERVFTGASCAPTIPPAKTTIEVTDMIRA
jgi:hypothetical protein